METKITTDTRPDQLDAEAFRDMMRSRAFGLLQHRINSTLEQAKNDCEREDDDLKLRRAQGQVAAYHVVLSLPEIMLGEMRRGIKYDAVDS